MKAYYVDILKVFGISEYNLTLHGVPYEIVKEIMSIDGDFETHKYLGYMLDAYNISLKDYAFMHPAQRMTYKKLARYEEKKGKETLINNKVLYYQFSINEDGEKEFLVSSHPDYLNDEDGTWEALLDILWDELKVCENMECIFDVKDVTEEEVLNTLKNHGYVLNEVDFDAELGCDYDEDDEF